MRWVVLLLLLLLWWWRSSHVAGPRLRLWTVWIGREILMLWRWDAVGGVHGLLLLLRRCRVGLRYGRESGLPCVERAPRGARCTGAHVCG